MITPSFEQLTSLVPDEQRPPLDRTTTPNGMDEEQRHWREHGYLVLPRFMPDNLINAYSAAREAHGVWNEPAPFVRVRELRDICLYAPLVEKIGKLIDDRPGLCLNLTGWVSTERNWHQDDYLNPPALQSRYAAVWIALDDIHPDSGPYEFVPGSHRWPVLSRKLVRELLPFWQRFRGDWPYKTQHAVTEAVEAEMLARHAEVRQYIPKRGDVLIWHSCLMHRGSAPRVPGMLRKSLIAHYAGLRRANYFPPPRQHDGGGWYFPFDRIRMNRVRGVLGRLGIRL